MDAVEPQTLLRHLIANSELITYMAAYEAILGDPSAWRHVHTQRVVAAALGTTPETVDGLRVRLDAFVVGKGTRRPASRHFLGKDYTEREWLSKFAARELCVHSARKIREGA
jgi:hypothetical protein